MRHVGTAAAPATANRSFELRAEITRPDDGADGVLIAHGSVNSGYCLMVESGHLVYDLNHYGEHHVTRSSTPVPLGTAQVAMRFEKDPVGTGGSVRLFVNGAVAGVGTVPAGFEHLVAFQGLDVGADRLSPVQLVGKGEFPFAGEMRYVTVEVLDGERSSGEG